VNIMNRKVYDGREAGENIDRRSGAPSAFACFLGLAAGVACAAMAVGCSASSGSTDQGGWGQSGGGPLGGGANNESSGSGNDASTTPTGPGAGSDAGAPLGSSEGGGNADAGASGDGASLGDAPGEAAAAVPDFTLINTTITTVIDGAPVTGFDPITEGATINLAQTGSALSIRANTIPALVGSVAFALDATYTHTENTVPYMLCADNGAGVITSCAAILTVGKHTLTATPYSAASLGGDAGAPILLDFTIVDIADAGITDAGGQ
jgi:hypothetical protein